MRTQLILDRCMKDNKELKNEGEVQRYLKFCGKIKRLHRLPVDQYVRTAKELLRFCVSAVNKEGKDAPLLRYILNEWVIDHLNDFEPLRGLWRAAEE